MFFWIWWRNSVRLEQTDPCEILCQTHYLEHNSRCVSSGVLSVLRGDTVEGNSNGFHPGSVTGRDAAGRSFCMELGTGSLHCAEQQGEKPTVTNRATVTNCQEGGGFRQHGCIISQFVGQKSELRHQATSKACRTCPGWRRQRCFLDIWVVSFRSLHGRTWVPLPHRGQLRVWSAAGGTSTPEPLVPFLHLQIQSQQFQSFCFKLLLPLQ